MNYHDKFSKDVKNILVVGKNNQVGDMICSLPLYAALKKKYPDSKITLVAAKTNYQIPITDINPFIDKIITLDRSSIKSTLSFLKELRNKKYQIGVVPSTITQSSTSHIINYLSGAKIRVGVESIDGKKNKSAYLLNVKSSFNWTKNKIHQQERNLDVVRQIGCNLNNKELEDVKIKVDEASNLFANEFISNNYPDKEKLIVGIHPGAGKENNIWSIENYKKLIYQLENKYHPYFLITAGHTDEEVIKHLSVFLNENNIIYKVAENLEIKLLGALLKKTDLYITNDTGPMHIADSVRAKVLALFGPTKSYEWGPTGKECFSIQSKTNNINNISVDEVYNICEKLLTKNK